MRVASVSLTTLVVRVKVHLYLEFFAKNLCKYIININTYTIITCHVKCVKHNQPIRFLCQEYIWQLYAHLP